MVRSKMFHSIFDNIVFFFIIINISIVIVASDDSKDDNMDRNARNENGGAMWFGPRVGKRATRLSNENDRQAFYRMLEAADALKYYYDQLPYYEAQADEPETRVTKKVIFTPKLGRSLNKMYDERSYENVDFTPRLGRRLADDLVTPSDSEVYRPDPEQIDSRSKYFSPRLGRTMTYTPRLGRELPYDIFPEKVRVARSTNKTKAA